MTTNRKGIILAGGAGKRLYARPLLEEQAHQGIVKQVLKRAWRERIISGEYLKYYEKQYGAR